MIRCHYCGLVLSPDQAIRREVEVGHTTGTVGNLFGPPRERIQTSQTAVVDLCQPCNQALDNVTVDQCKQDQDNESLIIGVVIAVGLGVVVLLIGLFALGSK